MAVGTALFSRSNSLCIVHVMILQTPVLSPSPTSCNYHITASKQLILCRIIILGSVLHPSPVMPRPNAHLPAICPTRISPYNPGAVLQVAHHSRQASRFHVSWKRAVLTGSRMFPTCGGTPSRKRDSAHNSRANSRLAVLWHKPDTLSRNRRLRIFWRAGGRGGRISHLVCLWKCHDGLNVP